MKKIITRAQVLKAIRTERLKAGAFFDTEPMMNTSGQYEGTKSASTCKVCAVGGVLRSAVGSQFLLKLDEDQLNSLGPNVCKEACTVDEDDEAYRNADEQIKAELRGRNYLGALSMKFEYMMNSRKIVSPFVRKELIKFVKKNFPKQIKVDLTITQY